MVKRKADCLTIEESGVEASDAEVQVNASPADPGLKAPVTSPIVEQPTEGLVSCHDNLTIATEVEELIGAADRFWAILATASYTTW